MFRAINEYLAKINVVTDQSMYEAMSSFLEKTKLVDNFSINVNYNRYIVDIKMKKYSVSAADKLYRKFISAIAYSYSQISVRYNEESRVRYRFASCKENKTGVYMDIIIAQA
ncbi:MAG: hypothetical protein K6F55_02760 [Eubacterium sp.]|nr:hypothetical protein [Eubacterium sp.]